MNNLYEASLGHKTSSDNCINFVNEMKFYNDMIKAKPDHCLTRVKKLNVYQYEKKEFTKLLKSLPSLEVLVLGLFKGMLFNLCIFTLINHTVNKLIL